MHYDFYIAVFVAHSVKVLYDTMIFCCEVYSYVCNWLSQGKVHQLNESDIRRETVEIWLNGIRGGDIMSSSMFIKSNIEIKQKMLLYKFSLSVCLSLCLCLSLTFYHTLVMCASRYTYIHTL